MNSNEKFSPPQIVNDSLYKIAKGAVIIFICTILGLLLGLTSRIVLARYLSQGEYGLYSLSLIIVNILIAVSALGLNEGSTRYIAYFKGKNEDENIKTIIHSSIQFVLFASILIMIFLLFMSELVAINLFNNASLSSLLQIFSISIPFSVLNNIFLAIFRGYNLAIPRLLHTILKNIIFITMIIIIVFYKLSFINIIFAYVLSIIITFIFIITYAIRKISFSIKNVPINNTMIKKLLVFSLPLFSVSILVTMMSWTDTLMLGIFKTPDLVGVYNVALPLANLIPVVLISIGFLYTPIISNLYGKNKMKEINISYAVSTKWCLMGTLPIFFILFLCPDVVINLLFGIKYVEASIILQILSMGFIMNPLTGPNYHTLIALGKTKVIFHTFLISLIVNIILNIVLIKSIGMIGAAIASSFSLSLATIILSIKLYQNYGIHPLKKNYIKTVTISILLIAFSYFIINFLCINFLIRISFILLVSIIYFFLLIFTKSIDDEDIIILCEIERRTNIDFSRIKNFLRRSR